jgi:hypothetical protein
MIISDIGRLDWWKKTEGRKSRETVPLSVSVIINVTYKHFSLGACSIEQLLNQVSNNKIKRIFNIKKEKNKIL